MALQLRRKTHESIVYIDKDSAPRIMPNGEDFIVEDIPIGTRVIYPNPPIKGLPNREAAIRYAVSANPTTAIEDGESGFVLSGMSPFSGFTSSAKYLKVSLSSRDNSSSVSDGSKTFISTSPV